MSYEKFHQNMKSYLIWKLLYPIFAAKNLQLKQVILTETEQILNIYLNRYEIKNLF